MMMVMMMMMRRRRRRMRMMMRMRMRMMMMMRMRRRRRRRMRMRMMMMMGGLVWFGDFLEDSDDLKSKRVLLDLFALYRSQGFLEKKYVWSVFVCQKGYVFLWCEMRALTKKMYRKSKQFIWAAHEYIGLVFIPWIFKLENIGALQGWGSYSEHLKRWNHFGLLEITQSMGFPCNDKLASPCLCGACTQKQEKTSAVRRP